MKSQVAKRLIVIRGRRTSVSLEVAFWMSIKEMAAKRSMSMLELISEIEFTRGQGGMASQIRVFILNYYKKQADLAQLELDRCKARAHETEPGSAARKLSSGDYMG